MGIGGMGGGGVVFGGEPASGFALRTHNWAVGNCVMRYRNENRL